MFEIIEKQQIAKDTCMMRISAPDIAKKAKAGQFVVIRTDEKAERLPLTIADHDDKTITIVFLIVGYSTEKLCKLGVGDSVKDLLGPLGRPTHVSKVGTVCVVGGGLGIAPIFMQARAWKEAGNKVITILGGRSKDRLFWLDKIEKYSDELIVCTDDGCYGRKGVVTDPLKELLDKADLVVAIGPVVMMKFVCETTKEKVKTIVSLNPIMLDGVGMCGVCRVHVGGEVKFACYDGPDFDGHLVNFEELIERNKTYLKEEKVKVHKCEKCKNES